MYDMRFYSARSSSVSMARLLLGLRTYMQVHAVLPFSLAPSQRWLNWNIYRGELTQPLHAQGVVQSLLDTARL